MRVDVLVLSGPAGVGKTTVAYEVSLQLARAGVAHALIDTDELDRIHPVPADLDALSERNLAAVWSGFAERGSCRLIVVGVYVDRPEIADSIRRAVPGADLTFVRLAATEAVLRQRVLRREVGSGAEDQLKRTRRQVQVLAADQRAEVHLIETSEVGPQRVAAEIIGLLGWGPEPTG